MSDAPDPLRSLFQQAGQDGVRRARPAPVAHIAERGRHRHRRRLAVAVAGLCLAAGTGGAAALS
ncbi:hypothetical protein G3I57_03515, partial [Streptomyces albidoflavus]|nr:hypothetical protein [Streptomyces albidoflavus]